MHLMDCPERYLNRRDSASIVRVDLTIEIVTSIVYLLMLIRRYLFGDLAMERL
jgi:hypothetical protein